MQKLSRPPRILLVGVSEALTRSIARYVGDARAPALVSSVLQSLDMARTLLPALSPDVLIVDRESVRAEGMAALRTLKAAAPHLAILAITGEQTGQETALRAAGVDRVCGSAELGEAIEAVVRDFALTAGSQTRPGAALAAVPAALRAAEILRGIEATDISLIALDLERRVILWNQGAERLYGWKATEVLGKLTPSIASEHAAAFERVFGDTLAGRGPQGVELRRRNKAGELIDIQLWAAPFRDAAGEVSGFLGAAVDIGDRKRAERALAESEARFRTLSTLSSDWYWEQDAAFRFVKMVYDQGREGVPLEDIVGRKRWEIDGLAPLEGDWAAHRRTLEAHETFRDFPLQYTDREGRTRYFLTSGEPVFDETGRFTGYRGPTRDVTADVRRERRLAETETQLREILDNSPALISVYDTNRRIRFANRHLADFVGLRSEDLVGRSVERFASPENAAALRGLIERAFAGESVQDEVTRFDASGKPRTLTLNYLPAHDAEGAINGVYGFHREITGRRRVEAERDRALDFARATLNALPQQVCALDPKGLIVATNPTWDAFARETGLPSGEDALGKRYFVPCCGNADARQDDAFAPIEAGLKRILNGEQAAFSAEYACRGGASPRWFVLKMARYGEAPGFHVVAVHDEITDAVRAREAVKAANERLEARVEKRTAELAGALRDLELFSHAVSHDLRGPARRVEGFATLLAGQLGPDADPEAARLLERIASSSREMGQLVESLFELTRVARQPLAREAIDTAALVREAWDGLDDLPAHARAELVVGTLPRLRADRILLKQVFVNLLGNALKFSAAGEAPRVEVGCDDAPGASRIWIQDNGVGFDPARSTDVLLPFVRLHRQDTYPGTGIGLALVDAIVRRHGGTVSVASEPGRGTRIGFTLESG